MVYTIASGNEDNRFELGKQHGVWALHFRKRIKQPSTFNVILHGRTADATVKNSENETYEKPLILGLRIIVIE